jgi:hypothetical protein
MWYPPFTFVRGFYLIQLGAVNRDPVQFLSASTGPNSEIAVVFGILATQAVFFFLLAIYLDMGMRCLAVCFLAIGSSSFFNFFFFFGRSYSVCVLVC